MFTMLMKDGVVKSFRSFLFSFEAGSKDLSPLNMDVKIKSPGKSCFNSSCIREMSFFTPKS